MDPLALLQLGLGAGGLFWLVTGLAVFLPLWFDLAYPLWGQPGKLRAFTLRSILVLAAATLPGGTLLGAALLLREHAGGGLDLDDPPPESSVPEVVPDGCPSRPAAPAAWRVVSGSVAPSAKEGWARSFSGGSPASSARWQ